IIMKQITYVLIIAFLSTSFTVSNNDGKEKKDDKKVNTEMEKRLQNYAKVELTANLDDFTYEQKKMLGILIDVADIMDEIFWIQFIAPKDEFLSKIDDEATKAYAKINYGPWDRLNGNKPFIEGYGEKPPGAQFYPEDITKKEFENWDNKNKNSWYTMVRRDTEGELMNIWYHEFFETKVKKAADLLETAAKLAENPWFKKYLKFRAEALRTDEYLSSDLAWLNLKDNQIDFMVGPIALFEDKFMGYRAAHSTQLLIKDIEWSKKLTHFGELMPELQATLPVSDEYKAKKVHTQVYTVYNNIYSAGSCNAGSKYISINLLHDLRIQGVGSSRQLLLKNIIEAKFSEIMVPMSEILIVEEQQDNITFDAFFENLTFYEMAWDLGITQTVTGEGSVRDVLKETFGAIEGAKTDITSLYLITKLHEMGEFPESDLKDNYVTFLANILRSIRYGYGIPIPQGKSSMLEFNHLKENGAIERTTNGKYKINFEKMKEVVSDFCGFLIKTEGHGNYEYAKLMVQQKAKVDETLGSDIERVNQANVPKDVIFEQGKEILGL
ncbi:MAG: Zn-dependent hydrolase, partial [Candidatus Delongbacteria bacterium]|nr:Zn-dependent hydrolase [Candidatus Delongbacteria bacterium]